MEEGRPLRGVEGVVLSPANLCLQTTLLCVYTVYVCVCARAEERSTWDVRAAMRSAQSSAMQQTK